MLSAREQQTLESTRSELACSAPELASMLAMFSRLTAGEKMPVRRPTGRAASGPGRGAGAAGLGRVRRSRLGREARRWLWLPVVLALLALMLIMSPRTQSTCVVSRIATCGQAPAHPGAARAGRP